MRWLSLGVTMCAIPYEYWLRAYKYAEILLSLLLQTPMLLIEVKPYTSSRKLSSLVSTCREAIA